VKNAFKVGNGGSFFLADFKTLKQKNDCFGLTGWHGLTGWQVLA